MVEVEPIRYRLEHLQYRTSRAKREKQVVVLARRTLSNDIEEGSENKWDTVKSIAAFNASYRFYWGQNAGLIRALPASAITLSNPQQNKLSKDETKVNISLLLPVIRHIVSRKFLDTLVDRVINSHISKYRK